MGTGLLGCDVFQIFGGPAAERPTRCGQHQSGHLVTGAAAQAEIASPMLHRFTVDVLARFDVKVPAAYFIGAAVPLANYWAMRRDDFDAYMQWSWPIIQWALALDHPFKHQSPVLASIDQRKAVGYFAFRKRAETPAPEPAPRSGNLSRGFELHAESDRKSVV